ncbi:hypothetical protein MCP_1714 [Methanocella paludicola SANAE]|uniref:Uncharacterized protein n=1 Tax=Methanocella paludicola (strain DSM 17711 / JCM 13418 / NBRC 101707 / SANAE) TaxID=304371 RepID=D1YZB4_METPS|nr:hypothetical protein MCP_1714 [Methanocella paludicola SANAE]
MQKAFANVGPIHRNGLKGHVHAGPNCATTGIIIRYDTPTRKNNNILFNRPISTTI